ncbi:site-specific integrase (plasmid) [Arsenophonus nasoniae]|uniref:Site-specific integrase n=3 Tax=Arsenophonus nasoniae TaxID=638 RepID=A0A4V1BXK4_9GAMM|nr:site-specific integrase [Arsenophonus nasoniae]QBY46003.1 Tyrosine recombinase XerC [Arsenophonus nasoniae]WGM08964.1 site-specific integrase [Arsenophonus nasoniae]WGM13676.1 site-specific integrase [Arsenophonus nasoniae]WGM18298.1 site-specific integrase [Arsenophonus nasoniae]
MSSIKLLKTRHGSEGFRVHYENTAGRFHKSFKTLDAACRFLFLSESERFLSMTAKEKERCRDWHLRKLIQFYIGKKVSQCETGHLRKSSLDTIKHALFSIDETLQSKLALHIRPREFNGLPENSLKYLHSAYLLLKEMRNIGVSPIPKLKKKVEKPIFIPAFENVDRMIEVAPVREKIAFILASVIGLRISEILALDYSDIQGEYLNISKHVTRNGVIEGLKADVQRLLPIPKALLDLLDKTKLSLNEPLITSQSGKRLSLNYSTTGIVKELLEKYRIGKFHNLRHFAAVRLIKKHNDIHVISKMLGHKNIETTSNIYGRFSGSIFELNF